MPGAADPLVPTVAPAREATPTAQCLPESLRTRGPGAKGDPGAQGRGAARIGGTLINGHGGASLFLCELASGRAPIGGAARAPPTLLGCPTALSSGQAPSMTAL